MRCHVLAIKRFGLIVFGIALIVVGSWTSRAESAIKVGVSNFGPQVSVRDNGGPEGLFVDVLEYVAAKEAWQIEYVAGSWDQCLRRVQNGDLDLLVAIGYSKDRASRLDFTKEFLLLDWGVVYKKTGSPIESISDLKGKKIGCLKGSIYTAGFKSLLDQFEIRAELVEKDEYKQVFKAAEDGEVDAAINTRIAGTSLGYNYHVQPTEIFFSPAKIGFAAPKGKRYDIIYTLDRYISALKSDKSSFYYRRLDHWTGFYKQRRLVSPWLLRAFVVVGVLCALSVGFVYILRRQVRIRTSELSSVNQALSESEQRYRAVFDNAAIGIDLVDHNGYFTQINSAFCSMLGYSREELRRLSVLDITHPEDLDATRAQMAALVKNESSSFRMEKRFVRKDGTIRWGDLSGTGFRNENGELQYTIEVISDITERKRAEASSRRSEARRRLLFSISQYTAESLEDLLSYALDAAIQLTESKVGYIYHYDEEAQLLVLNSWSKEAMEACKVAQKQGIYELSETGIWGDAVRQRQPIVVNDFQAPNPLKKGFPDGHIVLHKYMTVPVFSGNKIVSVIAVGNKLTDYDKNDVRQLSLLMDSVWRLVEVKRSEEARRRLAIAIEQAAEGVMITDTAGAIQYVNPALERISGFMREELIGKKPSIFKSGEHHKGFYRILWDTISRGETWTGRMVNRAKDGRLYQEEVTISPVRDSAGRITNFVAVKRDITEHLELSKQLFQAQKMEAVGTLAGGVAHDFNNLLQVILGYSELILVEEDFPDQFRSDLNKIHHAAGSGADLIQRLLTFSRKTEIKPLPLDLNRHVRQIYKLLARTIPRMIHIELSLAESLPAISADPTQVEQVIMNLAVNARDAMPDGGKLIIETACAHLDEEYAKIHVGAEPGHYVLLSVSDSGAGMSKEVLEHIFEPFYTTKGPGEGTGLGLAMVYGIVKQHNGYIMCYSEAGQGTTFKLYFPALDSESSEEPAPAKRVPEGQGETILVVDDEEYVRDLATQILVRSGYGVLTACDGNEALEIYSSQREKILLVILDVVMPHMGGKQCLEELLRLNPKVKVLVASGDLSSGPAKDVMLAGAKGFLSKPYIVEQMLQTVRDILDLQ